VAFLKKAFSALTKGLKTTRDAVVGGLRSILLGKKLDAALLEEIESRLIRADVGVHAARRLVKGLRADYDAGKAETGEDALAYLKRELKAMWPEQDRELRYSNTGTTVFLVTGVNGVGKTTSIAKLCAMLRSENKGVMLAACDTFRAGAVKQLEVWGERLGVEVIRGQEGSDPASVAFDAVAAANARGVDVLIVDTAGRLQSQDPLMRELSKIRGVLGKKIDDAPHETLLVLDATAGQNAIRQAEAFLDSAGVTGIVLAKLDGTAKGGVVVAIREATDIPVKFVGTGETPEDLAPFDPDAFVEAMFAEESSAR
jgi:fused signal recognition particle receptor